MNLIHLKQKIISGFFSCICWYSHKAGCRTSYIAWQETCGCIECEEGGEKGNKMEKVPGNIYLCCKIAHATKELYQKWKRQKSSRKKWYIEKQGNSKEGKSSKWDISVQCPCMDWRRHNFSISRDNKIYNLATKHGYLRGLFVWNYLAYQKNFRAQILTLSTEFERIQKILSLQKAWNVVGLRTSCSFSGDYSKAALGSCKDIIVPQWERQKQKIYSAWWLGMLWRRLWQWRWRVNGE